MLQADDDTRDVGTCLYSAPESKETGDYTSKVDIYALGVILLELWHPFNTGMERIVVIQQATGKRELPSDFTAKYPKQSEMILRLIQHVPDDRPSAADLVGELSSTAGYFLQRDQLKQELPSVIKLQNQNRELLNENVMLKQELEKMKQMVVTN